MSMCSHGFSDLMKCGVCGPAMQSAMAFMPKDTKIDMGGSSVELATLTPDVATVSVLTPAVARPPKAGGDGGDMVLTGFPGILTGEFKTIWPHPSSRFIVLYAAGEEAFSVAMSGHFRAGDYTGVMTDGEATMRRFAYWLIEARRDVRIFVTLDAKEPAHFTVQGGKPGVGTQDEPPGIPGWTMFTHGDKVFLSVAAAQCFGPKGERVQGSAIWQAFKAWVDSVIPTW